jgi:surface protein
MPIHITSKTKSLRVRPASKDELRFLIKEELQCQGPDADLNFIDTSLITDMSHLFSFPLDLHVHVGNIKIDEWDTSKVTDMSYMFVDCPCLYCDPSRWNVSGVISMGCMFGGCRELDCDLSNWNVSNVVDISKMFKDCYRFRGTGLPDWNVQRLQKMESAFKHCHILNCDLSGWEFSNPVDMFYAFDGCYSFPDDYKPKQVHRTATSTQSIQTAITNLASLQNNAMSRCIGNNSALIMNEEMYKAFISIYSD